MYGHGAAHGIEAGNGCQSLATLKLSRSAGRTPLENFCWGTFLGKRNCSMRMRYSRSIMINPFRKLLRLSPIPVPPQQLIDGVGGGDFNAIGKEFFAYFTDLCGLGRDDYVLDVGCGCGRMAVPLVAYLTNS